MLLETEGQVTRVKYRPISGEHRGNNRLTSADSLFSSLSGDDLCDNRVARGETVCRLLIHISNESRLIMRITVNRTKKLPYSVALRQERNETHPKDFKQELSAW